MSKQHVPVTAEDVQYLRDAALRAHRRYMATGEDSSFKLYKRMSSLWLKAKEKYDKQQSAGQDQTLF